MRVLMLGSESTNYRYSITVFINIDISIKTHSLSSRFQAKLAAVDATKQRALSQKFDIGGYPTLKHFLQGGTVIKDFQGARTKDGIIAAVRAVQGKDEL